jgi:hypothetical protein
VFARAIASNFVTLESGSSARKGRDSNGRQKGTDRQKQDKGRANHAWVHARALRGSFFVAFSEE